MTVGLGFDSDADELVIILESGREVSGCHEQRRKGTRERQSQWGVE